MAGHDAYGRVRTRSHREAFVSAHTVRDRPLLGLRRRPGRLTLWFMRLPQTLYRHDCGRLLGHTFLRITHEGRKTGRRHETVVMALAYDTEKHEAVVCSAWGPDTEWMRNLRAHPAVRIQIGRETFVPSQRFLAEDEAVAVATRFRDQHPGRLRLFAAILGWGDLGSESAMRDFVGSRPFIAFAPAGMSTRSLAQRSEASTGVDLYWLPLGAGGRSVRFNGRVYEALIAAIERRGRCDLYHSALEVRLPGGRYVIEMAPVVGGGSGEHGVVAGGAVGSPMLGWTNVFRYEVRCRRGGQIPDKAEAVESPRVLSSNPALAERILDLAPLVPTPTWGRDELKTGDMWNSNSLISWLLVSAGIEIDQVSLPAGGRAPGWDAGVAVAGRDLSPSVPVELAVVRS